MKYPNALKLPALRICQGDNRFIYAFAVDGKQLSKFSSIARISRDDDLSISGYQRPEVASHVSQIRDYLESGSPMIPNSIIVAFDDQVHFVPGPKASRDIDYCVAGTIHIPLSENGEPKVGWIVDGQQRAAAIREAKIESFPVSVIGFIASNEDEQREQFILVNSTKPLPKGLLYELLPKTNAKLPDFLQRRKLPTQLLQALNWDDDSPFHGLILSPTSPHGIVKDNSILRMLENSLSDGVLFRFRNQVNFESDIESILMILKNYWWAVKDVFSKEWGKNPKESRLMHGAGIISLGYMMDAIADRHRSQAIVDRETFKANLYPLQPLCRWTDGYWDFGPGMQKKWNEVQNTTKDIQILSNHLLVLYKSLVWNQASSERKKAGK